MTYRNMRVNIAGFTKRPVSLCAMSVVNGSATDVEIHPVRTLLTISSELNTKKLLCIGTASSLKLCFYSFVLLVS